MRRIPVQLLDYNPMSHDTPRVPVAVATTKQTLSPALSYILGEVRRNLGLEAKEEEDVTRSELEAMVQTTAKRLGFELSSYERDEILSQLEKDSKPFGLLQGLVDDVRISDIIVSSFSKVAVQLGRKNLSTDVRFPTQNTYEAFVEKLLHKAGTTYSTKKPIADGMIGSFARVHAVHRTIGDGGPYLTIRLNRFSSVDIQDLVKAGMAPREVFSYLSAMTQLGNTLLIAGEVGTGKTTLARALASNIPDYESILVIEDTQEIRLDHPHVRYMSTREANIEGAGRVTPSECIRGGMRMAMNRIIFGEVRDAEAAEAFIDVCASGHPGLSTIHARSAAEAASRLELFLGRAQRGADEKVIKEQIATAVKAIVYVGICSSSGKRRILEVREIGPVADGILRHREIFRYRCEKDLPSWSVVNKTSAHRDSLEGLREPFVLSSMPSVIELGAELLYKEAAKRRAV